MAEMGLKPENERGKEKKRAVIHGSRSMTDNSR